MSTFNFIDDTEKYQLYANGELCLSCFHKAHCGNGCYVEEDDTCDCFECNCVVCSNGNKINIGAPVD